MNLDQVLQDGKDGVLLRIHVQPKARRQQVVGLYNERLKVCVTEPPDRGRANAAVMQLLAEALQISRSQINLVRGDTSRQKDLWLSGQQRQNVAARLIQLLNASEDNSDSR